MPDVRTESAEALFTVTESAEAFKTPDSKSVLLGHHSLAYKNRCLGRAEKALFHGSCSYFGKDGEALVL